MKVSNHTTETCIACEHRTSPEEVSKTIFLFNFLLSVVKKIIVGGGGGQEPSVRDTVAIRGSGKMG